MNTATLNATKLGAYWELTKPRIALLVVVTAYAGMWIAAGGPPSWALVCWTLIGTAVASGSSAALNNYIDREVDAVMARTRGRALPSGRLRDREALWFGLLLGAVSFVQLWLTVNLLTAILALATIVFYTVIYTLWLKRTTPMCTSVGGIAGAAPPLIGWAAVTGHIGPPALAMFAIMFLWQPPHFWALAMMRSEEYRSANLPMLPVAKGPRVTKRQMLFYTILLIPASTSLYWLGISGPVYLLAAVALGVVYLGKTISFARHEVTPESAKTLFFFSIWYLAVLFVMMFADLHGVIAG